MALPVVASAAFAGGAMAQQNATSLAAEGEFERRYPEVAQILDALTEGRVLLYQRLANDPSAAGAIDQEFIHEVLGHSGSASAGESGSSRVSAAELARITPNLPAVLDAVEALHRQILDIYADESLADKKAAVDTAVDRYLALGDVALAPVPKDMGIMVDYDYATDFEDRLPHANALVWAADWLSIGVLEPLMMFSGDAKLAGVQSTVARFHEMLEDPPETSPSHMPMAPTMGPNFVSRHPRAAAILDNYHMLQDVLLDILVTDAVGDRSAAAAETVERFTDPSHLAIEDIDWIWMALRHGIYAQGGPAIGRMERPDRTGTHEHNAGNMVLPGM